MISGQLIRRATGEVLLPEVRRTTTGFERLRGLLASPEPLVGQGLLLVPCNSIHMFFMDYPLDILFLDREYTVLSWRDNLQPWHMASQRGAAMVLECRAGQRARLSIRKGENLQWRPLDSPVG